MWINACNCLIFFIILKLTVPVTHHSDAVIEQRLAEHDDVENLVHLDLLEDGQHGHGVHGGDERAEHEAVEQGDAGVDPAQPGHSIETHTWGHEGHRGQRLEQGDARVDPAQPGHSIETYTWDTRDTGVRG